MNDILLLILAAIIGTFLGFLGYVLNKTYDSRRLQKKFIKGIQSELGSLLLHLSLELPLLKADKGELTEEDVIDLRHIVRKRGIRSGYDGEEFNWLRPNNEETPEQIVQKHCRMVASKTEEFDSDLAEIRLRFIEANLQLMIELNSETSTRIFEFMRFVSIHNRRNARSNELFRMMIGSSLLDDKYDIAFNIRERLHSGRIERTSLMIQDIDKILNEIDG